MAVGGGASRQTGRPALAACAHVSASSFAACSVGVAARAPATTSSPGVGRAASRASIPRARSAAIAVAPPGDRPVRRRSGRGHNAGTGRRSCRSDHIVLAEGPRPPRSPMRERGSLTPAKHPPTLRLTSASFAGTSRPEGSGCVPPRALDLCCRSREVRQSGSEERRSPDLSVGQKNADLSGRLQAVFKYGTVYPSV